MNKVLSKQNAASSLADWMFWLNEQQEQTGSDLFQRIKEAKKNCSNEFEYLLAVRDLVSTPALHN